MLISFKFRILFSVLFLSAGLSAVEGYDSDSEDEAGYVYKPEAHLQLPDGPKKEAIVLYRGVHFSPSFFIKQQRSQARKENKIGKAVYALAAYDLAEAKPSRVLDAKKEKAVASAAKKVKGWISGLDGDSRNEFQEIYTNQYDVFNRCLVDRHGIFENFESAKNPHVSTSEAFRHAGKYAFGKKFVRADVKNLKPEYGLTGKPKHPYLGKVYVMVVDCDDIDKLDPYFVVAGHAQDKVAIFNHFSNDILSEREVSFSGLIPGKYVVYEKNIRMPSFKHIKYPEYYEQKYGINEQSYKMLRTKLTKNLQLDEKRKTTVDGIIEKIIKHTTDTLEKHIKQECAAHNMTVVYKSLDDGFCENEPTIQEAKDKRK